MIFTRVFAGKFYDQMMALIHSRS